MRRRRRGVRLELMSLMDVMFLVLVFFIYSIFEMTVHKGVKVDLPQANGVDEVGERVVITILQDNTLQLNGMTLSKEEIISRVKTVDGCGMDFPVIISGDRNSSLGVGIELLKELEDCGIKRVSFQVAREE